MRYRFLSLMALGLIAGATIASAQPGSITTSNNSNLIFAASTLLTNGLPGLSGPPVTLMVATVKSNSAQGGVVSLVGSQQWVRRYNGPANSEDQAMDVIADKDGNIIAVGYSTGSGSGVDYLTIKYTQDGVGLWTNRYNGPENGTDRTYTVAVDGSGGVYVSGQSGTNLVTIKYSSDGVPVWTNSYTSSGGFLLSGGIAVDNDGNCYMQPFDLDSGAYVTVKYDTSGNATWTNSFKSSATSSESAYDIAVDAVGNIFVTGSSFDNGSSCLTIKCDSDGSALWTNRYSFSDVGGADGTRVIVDKQGNIIVAAQFHGLAGDRYGVIKYSNSGAGLWTNVMTAVNYAGGGVPRIVADAAGNVFFVGGTPGATTADFTTIKYSSTGVPLWTNRFVDPNAGNYSFYGAATDNAGNLYWSIGSASPNGTNYNYVTLKYAANGATTWTNRYNGPANASDLPRGMTADKAGGVYVTGTSSSGGTSFSALDWATVKYADNVRYMPPPGFVGQDTITFTAFDSFGNNATSTVTIVVLPGPVTTTVVAPDDYTTIAGNTQLNTLSRGTNTPRTYQMQFTPDAMSGLQAGARITGLRFRIGTNSTLTFPATTVTWSDYEVRLAQAANSVSSMSTTFSANMLNPVLVKDGALSVAPNTFTVGNNPNSFATFVALDTPYVYQGGDLVMHFTHPGSDSTSFTVFDCVTNTSPGYGTSFRAITASTFAAASGAAAPVTIVEIAFTPPFTQAITRAGNQVIINGAGGLAGAPYRILTTTNVALPVAQWTPLTTNQFSAGGSFSYTNVVQPNMPARYFRVSMP